MSNDLTFGEKIKTARQNAGLTQEKLAQQADITLSTVQKIEKNRLNPSFRIVESIADVLGISLDSLRTIK